MSVFGMHLVYLAIGLVIGGSIASFIMLHILERNAMLYNKSIENTNTAWQVASDKRLQEWKTYCDNMDLEWAARAEQMVAEAIIKRDRQWRREEEPAKKKIIN